MRACKIYFKILKLIFLISWNDLFDSDYFDQELIRISISLTFYCKDTCIWLWQVIPPEIVVFFHFFLYFLLNQKEACDLSVVVKIFKKITIAFIPGNSLYCISLPWWCLPPPPPPNYSFPCCFQFNQTGILEAPHK